VSPYYWPSGYGYRTWYPHEYLPFVFLNATWFLNNYYYYDLPAPPYGYRWVRYGPDALLVNVYSGEVVDVVYGVFYW
jgi:Ni/Co efflux regulator RcnB